MQLFKIVTIFEEIEINNFSDFLRLLKAIGILIFTIWFIVFFVKTKINKSKRKYSRDSNKKR